MFHPQYTYINKTITDYNARPLLHDIIVDGKVVYTLPTLEEIREYAMQSLSEQWEEHKRLLNPEPYPVDLSQDLYAAKVETINLFKSMPADQSKSLF